jgi:hypothetical protein
VRVKIVSATPIWGVGPIYQIWTSFRHWKLVVTMSQNNWRSFLQITGVGDSIPKFWICRIGTGELKKFPINTKMIPTKGYVNPPIKATLSHFSGAWVSLAPGKAQ